MAKTKTSTTDKNLDRLTRFLSREVENSTLSVQIPHGSHIFHGAYNDSELTRANLKMATNIMLGMTLGYVEEAPLIMIFEYQPKRETVINLSGETYKKSAQILFQSIQEKNQRELSSKIDELVAV